MDGPMETTEGVPEPSGNGVTGTQQVGLSNDLGTQVAAPLEGVLLSTVRGLAISNPRSLGGDSNAAFLAGIVHHLTEDLESVKKKLGTKEQTISELMTELSQSRITTAQLTEQLKSASQSSRINQWTGIFGTALLGIALDMYKSNMNLSYAVAVLGGCILILPIAATHLGRQG
jgi:hypothetical protein